MASSSNRWIRTAGFDLPFFILSPLIALPVLIVSPKPSLLSLSFACIFGVPHYLSTFTFFFWDETRNVRHAQWGLFAGGPIAIVSVLAVLFWFRVPEIVQVVLFTWNAYHVARQNCGLLSIYRHRAGVRDESARTAANGAIISVAMALTFWNPAGYPTLQRFMLRFSPSAPDVVRVVTIAVAIVMVTRLAISLMKRWRGDSRPGGQELTFLTTSLLMFHPYLWIHSADQATLGLLLGHFVQYLAIVWFVQQRRLNWSSDAVRTWLGALASNRALLIFVLALTGVTSLGIRLIPSGRVQFVYGAAFISLSIVHFYLDGLFWAFKRQEVRQFLGRYLNAPLPAVHPGAELV